MNISNGVQVACYVFRQWDGSRRARAQIWATRGVIAALGETRASREGALPSAACLSAVKQYLRCGRHADDHLWDESERWRAGVARHLQQVKIGLP